MLGVFREVEKEARKEKKVEQLFRKRESKKNFIIIYPLGFVLEN